MQGECQKRPRIGGSQDVFYASRNRVPLPLIERASGVYMWDDHGNQYIDASSGPMVSNIGHGVERVVEAMARQARRVDYAYTRVARNRPNIEYAERLARLAGPGFERVSLASGGSEAVDNAIKFLRQYAIATGHASKRRVITCQPSYHGGTIATLAMSGEPMLERFLDGFASVSDKVPAPLSYRLPARHTRESYARQCADALEQRIEELGPDQVLAFMIEPVGGLSTGAVVPPAAYFRRVRDICTRHGVYLVFDEVLCGTGRTGKFLAAHHWPDALPDVVVKAKGLGSGYTPLGAFLAPARMVDELAGLAGCEFTYSYNANPISCAAGLAVLDEYERLGLVERAVERGARLRAGLEELQAGCRIIGDVRGLGLLLAVELVADRESRASLPRECRATERIRIHGLNHGLLLYSRRTSRGEYGDWFMLAPPLTISEAECDELLLRLAAALSDYARELDASV